MNETLFDALEQALIEIDSEENIKATLSKHPQVETDFRPILETMQAAYSISSVDIPIKTINRSRTRILARAAQLRLDRKSRRTIFHRIPRLAYAFILAVIITLMSFSGLSIASAQSLPGDQLYPLKRAAENIRLSLSVTLDDHYAVEDRYKARRIEEVEALLAAGRIELVEFFGLVNQQDDDRWNIGGVDVRLSSDTIILGDILIGVMVEVEGATGPDGWVQASEIHLQTYGFVGFVETISPTVWQISGKVVHITPESRVDPEIQEGDWVVVSVRSDDFGVLTALIIDDTNLPTPTPIPTLSPESTIKPSDSALTATLLLMEEDEGSDDYIKPGDGEAQGSEDSTDSEQDNHPEDNGDNDDSQDEDQGESEDGDNEDESEGEDECDSEEDDEGGDDGDDEDDGEDGEDGDDGEDDDDGDEEEGDDSEEDEEEDEDGGDDTKDDEEDEEDEGDQGGN